MLFGVFGENLLKLVVVGGGFEGSCDPVNIALEGSLVLSLESGPQIGDFLVVESSGVVNNDGPSKYIKLLELVSPVDGGIFGVGVSEKLDDVLYSLPLLEGGGLAIDFLDLFGFESIPLFEVCYLVELLVDISDSFGEGLQEWLILLIKCLDLLVCSVWLMFF